MRRLVTLLLLAAAIPATAQTGAVNRPSAYETYRTRTVTVYGNDACPKPNDPDEIVVCARRPEDERYRLKNPEAEPGARLEQGGQDRTLGAMDLSNAGGSGSCTSVGPGGSAGCAQKWIARERAQRKLEDKARNEAPPER